MKPGGRRKRAVQARVDVDAASLLLGAVSKIASDVTSTCRLSEPSISGSSYIAGGGKKEPVCAMPVCRSNSALFSPPKPRTSPTKFAAVRRNKENEHAGTSSPARRSSHGHSPVPGRVLSPARGSPGFRRPFPPQVKMEGEDDHEVTRQHGSPPQILSKPYCPNSKLPAPLPESPRMMARPPVPTLHHAAGSIVAFNDEERMAEAGFGTAAAAANVASAARAAAAAEARAAATVAAAQAAATAAQQLAYDTAWQQHSCSSACSSDMEAVFAIQALQRGGPALQQQPNVMPTQQLPAAVPVQQLSTHQLPFVHAVAIPMASPVRQQHNAPERN